MQKALIKFEYSQTNYNQLIKHYAQAFGTKVKDGAIALPPAIGEGSIRVFILSNGLQVFISDYTLAQDLLLTRKKNGKDFYLLRFEEMITPSALHSSAKSAVFLSNTNNDHLFLQTAGTSVKVMALLFTREWMQSFFSGNEGESLMKYMSANMKTYIYEQMDGEYRSLVSEAVNASADRRFEHLILQTRGMLLLERFFTRQYLKMTDVHFNLKISAEEIASLKLVEAEMLKDFSEPPDTIKLSRMAAMSASKLKTSFKEMFGLPLYQYYQKNRMNKAKAMLLSRRYSVREVSEELGFLSTNNFAKAFYKSFEQFPNDLLN